MISEVSRKHLYRLIKDSRQRVTSQKTGIPIHNYAHEYKPWRIHNTRDSLFWRWRRVAEWEREINDPYENIEGCMIPKWYNHLESLSFSGGGYMCPYPFY